MPSRKQRRRRAKSFRHEYEYVLVDEEGREVAVEPSDLRAGKEREQEKSKAKPQRKAAARGKSRGAMREFKPPSWRRVGKRGLIFAPLMFVAVSILDQGKQGYPFYAGQTLFLLAFFLPFSYVMDTIGYRMYLKRTGQSPQKDEKGQASSRTPR
jgi:hypothetical protein